MNNYVSSFANFLINLSYPFIFSILIVRQFGFDALGDYAIFFSTIGFLSVFLELGFGNYLPQISPSASIPKIFLSYLTCKAILLPVALLTSYVLLFEYQFWLVALAVIISVFDPTCFCLATNKYKKITFINGLVKPAAISVVFYFLDNIDDVYDLILTQVFVNLIIFLALNTVTLRADPISRQDFVNINQHTKSILRETLKFYYPRLVENLINKGAVFLASLLLMQEMVGVFALLNQLFRAAYGIIGSFAIVFYTKKSELVTKLKELSYLLIFNFVFWMLGFCVIYFSGELILETIFNQSFKPIMNLVYIVYFILIFASLSTFLGYPFLTILNRVELAHSTILYPSIIFGIIYLSSLFMGKINILPVILIMYSIEITSGSYRAWIYCRYYLGNR
ncbi:hypothetical protein OAW29_03120 [Planktomarina temperata]|nr:hypothetical protein [Planktomarina temperata]